MGDHAGFCTTLQVEHVDGKTWRLLQPLVWKGSWQYIVIRAGFETDFASIPKLARWLLDNAGRNAEAGVLHDAAWRESKRKNPRIDPWFADGMLRRGLRETGSTALTRTLIWFGVRTAAMVRGRFGKQGPNFRRKVLQLLGVVILGAVSALGPTIVAGVGLVVFFVFNWLVAVVWWFSFERKVFHHTNWPWPKGRKKLHTEPPREELLAIFPFKKDPYTKGAPELREAEVEVSKALAHQLQEGAAISEEQLRAWLAKLKPAGAPMTLDVALRPKDSADERRALQHD
jgi:hypothetical protein